MRNGGADGFVSVIGIAFLPDTLKTLTSNMLEKMGFRSARHDRSLRFESAATNGGAPPQSTLYFYDRSATNRVVVVAKLNPDCTRAAITNIILDKRTTSNPRDVIPAITGPAAIRLGLAEPANAPGPGDFHKQAKFPGQDNQRRPVYAR